MTRKSFLFFVCIFFASLLCAGVASAQLARDAGKMAESYVSINNDIKCYEITYELANDKDYIKYSEAVRQKIRDTIMRSYRTFRGQGDVRLVFILSSTGALSKFEISQDSTDNESLLRIAQDGLKKSSPFPPFPKTIELDEMAFSIIISFQKR